MTIIDNRERTMQPFHAIGYVGEVFEYANEIFMRIKDIEDNDNYYNAVSLNDGELWYFADEQVLILKNVSLQVD